MMKIKGDLLMTYYSNITNGGEILNSDNYIPGLLGAAIVVNYSENDRIKATLEEYL